MAKVEVRAIKTFLLDETGVSYEKGDTLTCEEEVAKRILDAEVGEIVETAKATASNQKRERK